MADPGFGVLILALVVCLVVGIVLFVATSAVTVAVGRATRPSCPHCGLRVRRRQGLCKRCVQPLSH